MRAQKVRQDKQLNGAGVSCWADFRCWHRAKFSAKGLGRPLFIFTPGTSMEPISRAHCLQLLRRQLALKLFCPSKWLLAKLLETPANPTWWFQVVVESGWQVSEDEAVCDISRKKVVPEIRVTSKYVQVAVKRPNDASWYIRLGTTWGLLQTRNITVKSFSYPESKCTKLIFSSISFAAPTIYADSSWLAKTRGCKPLQC